MNSYSTLQLVHVISMCCVLSSVVFFLHYREDGGVKLINAESVVVTEKGNRPLEIL